MKNLYVLGGQQRTAKLVDEWHQFKKAVIVRVDARTGKSEPWLEYLSPPDACAVEEEPSILFKAATLRGQTLYACTSTEVITYGVPDFKRIGYISLPCFNDLHHVCPTAAGNLLVVSTGLDMVIELTPDGEILREWNVLGEDPWERFSKSIDYRKVLTTKPHKSHPNYVFQMGDDIWVTRFEQKDAVCLTRPECRIEIGIERPHDGILHNGFIYFTTVDGHLVIANQDTLKTEEIIDLNRIDNESKSLLGWCRGLMIVDDKRVWVGFSRLRPTKFRENLSWIKHGFNKTGAYNMLPSRIALYDIFSRTCIKEIDLEPDGLNSVFSIVAEPGSDV